MSTAELIDQIHTWHQCPNSWQCQNLVPANVKSWQQRNTQSRGGGGGWGWLLGWTVSDRFGQMLLLSFQPVMIFACPLQMSASKTGTVQRQLSSLRHVGLHCKYSESTQWWRRLGSLHLAWSWFTSFCLPARHIIAVLILECYCYYCLPQLPSYDSSVTVTTSPVWIVNIEIFPAPCLPSDAISTSECIASRVGQATLHPDCKAKSFCTLSQNQTVGDPISPKERPFFYVEPQTIWVSPNVGLNIAKGSFLTHGFVSTFCRMRV